jgi:hypothetical protein
LSRKENPFHKIRNLFKAAWLCGKAYPLWAGDYFRALRRALRFCREDGFTPEDVYKLDMMHPDPPPEVLAQYLSKKKMTEMQSRLNPGSWINVTEDKGIFYVYAKAWGLPIPRLYALYFQKSSGWAPPNVILSEEADWIRFLEKEAPEEFIIKPCRGVYGKKVRIFIKSGKEFNDPFGKDFTAQDIYNIMAMDKEYDRFVIQERLVNHPELARLTGKPFLQTVRISSLLDGAGKCHLVHGSFRMIAGHSVVDNFSGGRTGNLLSGIDMETGRLMPAMTNDERGIRVDNIRIHPASGMRIEGFRLPFWEEARGLILETAPKFLPIRTLGWDIGLTPEGPRIVEANMFWDPPNQSRRGRVLYSKLVELGMIKAS